MIRIAVFASGSGSNAEVLIHHFAHHPEARVVWVLSDKAQAGVHARAQQLRVPSHVFSKEEYTDGSLLAQWLKAQQIDLVVLAGYLKHIPPALVAAYPHRIINLHPALLPKYGGKGMYGLNVHEAVLAAGETESGITIHYVNEAYDEGKIIRQVTLQIDPTWTAADLQKQIHALEHIHLPLVVEKICADIQANKA